MTTEEQKILWYEALKQSHEINESGGDGAEFLISTYTLSLINKNQDIAYADQFALSAHEKYFPQKNCFIKEQAYISSASSLLPKIKELEEELRKFHIEIYHAAKGYSEMTSILNGQLGDAMALNKVEDIIAETSKKKRQSKSEISKLEEQNRVMREALEAIKCMISPIDYDGMGLHIGATRMLAITSLAKVN